MKTLNYFKIAVVLLLTVSVFVSCDKDKDEEIDMDSLKFSEIKFSEIYKSSANDDVSDVVIGDNSIHVTSTKSLNNWHGVLLEDNEVEIGGSQTIEYTITKQTELARLMVGYLLKDDVTNFKKENNTYKYLFVYSQIFNSGISVPYYTVSKRAFIVYYKDNKQAPNSNFDNYELGDRFKIVLKDKVIKYYKNDDLFFTDSRELNSKVIPAITFNNLSGGKTGEIEISDIKISK